MIAYIVSAVVVCLSAVLYYALQRLWRHQLLRRHGIPGPKPHLLFGNFDQVMSDPSNFEEWRKQYGDVYGYYVGDEPIVVLNDVDLIRDCFLVNQEHFPTRPKMKMAPYPFDQCLLQQDYENWKSTRAVMSPSFSAVKLKLMSKIMNDAANTLVEVAGRSSQQNPVVDMMSRSESLTLEVIARCCLALKPNCQRDKDDYLMNALKMFLATTDGAINRVAQAVPMLNVLLKPLYPISPNGKFIEKIVLNIKHAISERRKRNEKIVDILQLLLNTLEEEKYQLTDDKIAANCLVFLIAGYETTALTLAFAIHSLAKHPEFQEAIRHEVTSKISNPDDVDYNDVKDLELLNNFIDETLRFYPPVQLFITRECVKNYALPDGKVIPKGSVVLAPTYQIHHNPKIWEDPETFDPLRHRPENSQNRHPAAYLPFGLGNKMCIGKRFALLEIRIALVKLLSRYRITKPENFCETLKLKMVNVVLWPEGGVNVALEPLD